MPAITSAGVGSGLDVQSIVSQLMAIERLPLQRLQQKQTQYEAQISAYGQLKSSLSDFQTAMKDLGTVSALKVFSTTSANENVIKSTASETASPGVYGVEVLRRAENHKLSSDQFLNTDTFGGGAGDSMTIQVGADATQTLTVDMSTALTLDGIRSAINDDPNNPGVTATVINGDAGNQKLIITSSETGSAKALTFTYGGAITAGSLGLTTVNNINGDTSLLDAQVNIDGYTATRSSNSISDVISGVTLDLVNADPGTVYTIAVNQDLEKVQESVQKFADSFNALRTSIKDLRGGQLEADSSLLSIERQVFSVLNTPATGGTFSVLSEVGLSMQKDGTMTLNPTDLKTAMQSDFNGVSQLFAADGQGFANRLNTLADTWLTTGGLIETRTDGLNSRINILEDQQAAFERRLVTTEDRLRAQFSALDTLVGQLQSTGSFLSQQLSSLPGANQG